MHLRISILWPLALASLMGGSARGELSAGAAVVDVTPTALPVLVNGGMLSREAGKVKTPLNARALVLDDGDERVAIVVVDSCMMPRQLLDEAKAGASTRRQDPGRSHADLGDPYAQRCRPAWAASGTDADPVLRAVPRGKLVEAIAAAAENLEPARVGWGDRRRRGVTRPCVAGSAGPTASPKIRSAIRPSGPTCTPAATGTTSIGESGPEDPDLSLIAVQSTTADPLAVLANFSMHYFGDQALSADYFGLFSEGLKPRIAADSGDGRPPFVGMMSHGCSGDIWRMDYTKPPEITAATTDIESYSQGLIDLAVGAYEKIEYSRRRGSGDGRDAAESALPRAG